MSTTTTPPSPLESMATLLRALKLPAFLRYAEEIAHKAEREGWTFGQYLRHLAELEIHERQSRRLERFLKTSDLPREKTLATLNRSWLSPKVAKTLPALCEGGFVERGDNVLVFGLPGRGKTHLVCAIGHELIQHGYRVLFTPTFALVQRLLAAKRDLRLEKQLATLDGYDAIICDDLGYVQQSRDEMEVLFTFLAERYERRSVIITSNVVFSEWDRIFKDPMTTMAAIDRLVHHSVIVEMNGNSIRADEAAERAKKEGVTTTTTMTDETTATKTTTGKPSNRAEATERAKKEGVTATTTITEATIATTTAEATERAKKEGVTATTTITEATIATTTEKPSNHEVDGAM